jgi:hypothetical protein
VKRRLMNPIGLGLFGAVGLALLFYCHGFWFEHASRAGLINVTSLPIEPSMFNSLRLGLPFVVLALALLFVNIFVSTNQKTLRKTSGPIFPSLTFVLLVMIGVCGGCAIPLASNWYVWLTILIYSGICAFSHQVFISSIFFYKSIDSVISTYKNAILLSKGLELEHNYMQVKLQWLVWGCIIFVTAGIITVLFNPLEFVPKSVFTVYVINTLLITTWSFLGILLGIIVPISTQMRYLREAIVTIATKQ